MWLYITEWDLGTRVFLLITGECKQGAENEKENERRRKEMKKVDVPIVNSNRPDEPTFRYKNQMILWCAPRKNLLWTAVKYHKDKKEIVKIYDEKQQEAILEWLKRRCAEIDVEPKNETIPKTSKQKKELKPFDHIQMIKKRMDELSGNHKGIHIPSSIMPTDKWFAHFCKEQGYVVDWENRVLAKGE